ILIVDDVFTTGATINSASNLLRNNGVNKIYVLTIARA
ncbi:MAG: ComF family protein, partial [Candidatus Cloacimonetes bacterium]|nr:ComF family protein [Candidatus Cloacimonadota bacterium]